MNFNDLTLTNEKINNIICTIFCGDTYTICIFKPSVHFTWLCNDWQIFIMYYNIGAYQIWPQEKGGFGYNALYIRGRLLHEK